MVCETFQNFTNSNLLIIAKMGQKSHKNHLIFRFKGNLAMNDIIKIKINRLYKIISNEMTTPDHRIPLISVVHGKF